MTDPRLSIVMPVHDGARWLGSALASLPAHEPGIEVVIRDSTPTGGCDLLIEAFRDRLAINYRWVPEWPGWTGKTNCAVAAARGTHVAILHQDDLWLAGRYARFVAELDAHPATVMFLSPAHIVDEHGTRLGTWRMPLHAGEVDPAVLRSALVVQNSIAMPAPIVRRDAYRAVGGLDETLWYTPDWDLWLKLSALRPVRYDTRPGTAFRIHGSSLTMTGDRGELAAQLSAVLDRHLPGRHPATAICRASVRINVLLARAAQGDWRAALSALATIARLGPRGAAEYLTLSRVVERALPRLRARLAGGI